MLLPLESVRACWWSATNGGVDLGAWCPGNLIGDPVVREVISVDLLTGFVADTESIVPRNEIVKVFHIGWVEERAVVQGCTDYGAEDACKPSDGCFVTH